MTTSPGRPVVLVTGGSQRIGRALCLAFADAGYDVVVHFHRSEAAAAATVAGVAARGGAAVVTQADLANVCEARTLASAALSAFGRLDVLVNNASVFHPTPLAATDAAAFDAATRCALAVHVESPVALVHALAPELRARGGSVVNVGDAAGPRPNYAPYAASKAALESLTRSLARELAPDVRVNMVAPGAILPPTATSPAGPGASARIIERVPAGRFGTVEEIGAAAVFLATGPAFVTGQVLGVDGGQYA
jgi:pteridine reductase